MKHFHTSAAAFPPSTLQNILRRVLPPGLFLSTALIYYCSNPQRHSPYDYTLRIAEALLSGRVGLDERPPSWLNEMVPYGGYYYSVFPLGAVLCMVPVALLKLVKLVKDFPSAAIVAVQAGAAVSFLFGLTSLYADKLARRIVLSLFPMFATWSWCNLAFGGAWQIALGFALLGQIGAIYFTLVKRRPLQAGLFFAMAFGNRSEVVLTAPLFVYLLLRRTTITESSPEPSGENTPKKHLPSLVAYTLPTQAWGAVQFLLIPFLLGICTLAYNYLRFGSITDFGYARIPGVLSEPWYQHGIFSVYSIPGNAHAMIFNTWKRVPNYPYLTPDGFGESIFLSCPLLALLFRPGSRDKGIRWASWIALGLLTFLLWIHGNPGGWQYSYRYAMVLLPWMFMIMLECGPPKWPWLEQALFGISVAINAWATYLFLWTNYVKP